MKIDTTIPITKARKDIYKIANEVQKPNTYFTLTENGVPKAVIMSAEEFEAWKDTLQVKANIPEIDQAIKESKVDLENQNYKRLADFARKQDLRSVLKDEHREYDVVLRKETQEQISSLAKVKQKRILQSLDYLANNPELGQKLTGNYSGYRLLQIYPYALVYKILKKDRKVYVI